MDAQDGLNIVITLNVVTSLLLNIQSNLNDSNISRIMEFVLDIYILDIYIRRHDP